MKSLPTRTRAAAIVQSRFALLRPFYLPELQLVVAGVPAGPLILSQGLHAAGAQVERSLLHACAADAAFQRWQRHFATRILHPDDRSRAQVLARADAAQAEHRHRRAVQLYGWLLLTAAVPDHPLRWAVHHLHELRDGFYGAPGIAAP